MASAAECLICSWRYYEHPSRPEITAWRAADGHWAQARHPSLIRRIPAPRDEPEKEDHQLDLLGPTPPHTGDE